MVNCSAEEYYHPATEDCRNCREVCGPTKIFAECVLRCPGMALKFIMNIFLFADLLGVLVKWSLRKIVLEFHV